MTENKDNKPPLVQVQVYLPEPRIEALRLFSTERGMSLSGICKLAINEHIDSMGLLKKHKL
jgi:hypothetical protein